MSGNAWSTGPSLTLEEIRKFASDPIFTRPVLALVVWDANLPPEICVKATRTAMPFLASIYGSEMERALNLVRRPQDFIVIIPVSLERTFAVSLAPPQGLALFGTPVWRIDSPTGYPWRRALLSEEITEWLAEEREAWLRGLSG